MSPFSSKLSVEFIGTFFLVLTIGLVVLDPGAGALAPVAIGSVLAVLVYAGGPVSGAHYNPAVTLAVRMLKKMGTGEAIAYMAVQLLAAAVAAGALAVLRPGVEAVAATPAPVPALVGELLFTFLLVYVILSVVLPERVQGNGYFGFAIGFTVLVGAFAIGPISGAALNPAVAVGVAAMGLTAWTSIWIYLVACFAGGAVAALIFRGTHPETAG